MITKVTVNVTMTIPVECDKDEAVASFVEKLARDKIIDILDCPENKIDVVAINAISRGIKAG